MPEFQKNKKLPKCLCNFFWDVDFKNLSEKDSYFIINRLLEHGDETGVKYMLKTFSSEEIIQVLKTSRNLSFRSKNFWKLFFKLNDKACTHKQYPTPYGTYYQS
ncbi:MAG: hypothetical protein DRP14_03605 [Candidatus Aenigmatarchaeota archaeon]|nr:MAG: hypothetical protein DRH24_01500 [Deltaproteobacteria bacterium]RLJ04274.1 MAG: hypothetical protein DRP14_03605 [Candidatus Aenigmarchaeota archaeon]